MRPKIRLLLLAIALLGVLVLATFERRRLPGEASAQFSTATAKAAQNEKKPSPSTAQSSGGNSGATTSKKHELWSLSSAPTQTSPTGSHDTKGKGRSVELRLSLTSGELLALAEGETLAMPGFDGEVLVGKINLKKVEPSGLVMIGGRLMGPVTGTFSLSFGRLGINGSILIPEKEAAYVLTQKVAGASEANMVEKKLSDVVCYPFPKVSAESSIKADTISAEQQDTPPATVVPILNSRPAATAVLYMDFDGETVSDPSWNGGQTIVAKPATLTREEIIEVWNRVSEDYVGFDVDITTDVQRYNGAQIGHRMRCIVTPTDTAWRGAGGVAMVGSFAESGKTFSDTIPCWVFNPGVIGVAEAVSHELGHTLGLRHDGRTSPQEEYYLGQGDTNLSWAPIMGAGYYKKVVQWSKGEYAFANNQEDDIAVIASPLNGFGFSQDEAGDTPATAAAVSTDVIGQVNFGGVIQSSADIDMYKFTAPAGLVHIDAKPAAISPDLDILLELKNASGSVLASSNPDLELAASITTSVSAGTYYLSIRGTGRGDPAVDGYSNYGSAGSYTFSGAIPVGDGKPFVASGLTISLPRFITANYQLPVANAPTSYSATGLPAGVVLDTHTGVISGIPTAAEGSYTVNVTMTNALGSRTGTFVLVLTKAPVPTISMGAVALARLGRVFSLGISATALPQSYSATGLPSGLSLNSSTGVISGTPTVMGSFPVSVSATNSSGTGSAQFAVVVVADLQKVSGSPSHSLFIRDDATLWGAGANNSGQLGIGNTTSTSVPVQISSNVISASAGYGFTLFLKADGSLWAAGENGFGQLGDGSGQSKTSPVKIATGVASIAAGHSHSLFLKTDGTLWGMGSNDSGQLGDGTTSPHSLPIQIAVNVATMTAGASHSLLVKTDGTLWAMGDNAYGQLGDGTKIDRLNAVKVADNVFSASAGFLGTTFITKDATLWGMGYNGGWQLGVSDGADKPLPIQIATGVVSSASGTSTNYFLKPDGTLWLIGSGVSQLYATPIAAGTGVGFFCTNGDNLLFKGTDGRFWGEGWNPNGLLGDGSVSTRILPVLVADEVYSIGVGTQHSLLVKLDGSLWTCGQNSFGQLGDGTKISRGSLVKVASDVRRAVGGFGHTLFIKSDGTLWGMGARQNGQLKSPTSSLQPNPALLDSAVSMPAAGGSTSLLLKSDATLWGMGANDRGQLGDGSTTDRTNEILIASGVRDVAMSSSHSLFTRTNGTLWAMGFNPSGELGDGTTINRLTPVQIASNVSRASASSTHSLFLKADGTLWGMGSNAAGQLGDGTTTDRYTPVSLDVRVTAFAADDSRSFFVKDDATLWAVGAGYGLTPSRIARGVKNLVAGGGHVLFQKIDDSVWAMGENSNGQLGDGSVSFYENPVEIKLGRPAITSQSMPFEVALNGATTFSITAAGEGSLGYQWRKNGVAIAGATASSYTVTNAQAANGGIYDVVVTNSAGTLISTSGVLTVVGAKPQFTSASVFSAPRLVPLSFRVKTANDATAFSAQNLPAGLSIDASSGLISGVPTASAGVFAVNLTATNAQGSTSMVLSMTITGEPIPVVSSGRTIVGRRGMPLSYSIAATPQPQSFGATGLPAGLTLNTSTGVISGIPAGAAGTSVITVSATNQAGTGTLTVKLAILPEWQGRVAGNGYSSFVVDNSGVLWGAGDNFFGELGIGSTINHGSAIPVATDVVLVANGITDTLFIKKDGTLWGMGWNLRGGLGLGHANEVERPALITSDVIVASIGFEHSLFLKADGGLWATGGNTYGQLGDGTVTDRYQPVLISNNVAALAANGTHSLFVKADHTLWSMGSNGDGELGDGTTDTRVTPVQIATGVQTVSASPTGSLFIKNDGSLWGMGSNGSQQISSDTSPGGYILIPAKLDEGVVGMAAGINQNLYLKTGGSLWGRGNNWWAQLGDQTKQFDMQARQLAVGVEACDTGQYHSIFWQSDGSAWTMGTGVAGGLADGYDSEQRVPVRVGLDVKCIAAGADHSVFVTQDGSLWGMGYNGLGSLGDGTNIDRADPVKILDQVATVTTAFWHDLVIKYDGSLWAVGNNGDGELGIGSIGTGSYTYQQIDTNVKKAAAGGWHTLYLKNDGTAWATGANTDGQLGDGTNVRKTLPVQVMSGVVDVAAGYRHSFFLKSDGTLWATGLNESGQLGDGTKINRQTPVKVAVGVAQIAAGGWHSLFLKTDGTLWSMGFNGYGQLGDGTSSDQASPILVAANVRTMSAGQYHSLLVKLDGTIWAMGQDDAGQLGDAAAAVRPALNQSVKSIPGQGFNFSRSSSDGQGASLTVRPVEVTHVNNDRMLSAEIAEGRTSSQPGLQGDGALTSVALIGNGTVTQQSLPVQIGTGGFAVSAGGYHSLYARTDGSLWAMGRNGNGRLGNGGGLVRWQPGQVKSGLPAILSQSMPYSVHLNERVQMAVDAVGSGALSYQWRKDGQPIVGATGSRYEVTAASAATGGLYDVVVTNSLGSKACTAVNLSVVDALPVISGNLTVSFPRLSDGFSYRISANNDPTGFAVTGLPPGLSFDARTGVISGKINAPMGTYQITIRANNANGFTSATLTLNVLLQAQPLISSALTVLGRRGQLLSYAIQAQNSPVSFSAQNLPEGLAIDVSTGVISGRITAPPGRKTAMLSATNSAGTGSVSAEFIVLPESAGLAAGRDFSLIVDETGALWAMGGAYGQPGGFATEHGAPTQVAQNVVAIAALDYNTLVLKTDGTLWGIGPNQNGQLGDGTTIGHLSMIPIATHVQACAAGSAHSLFLDWDGTLWAMGGNSVGELGDGSLISRLNPVSVMTGVESISAGDHFSLFVKRDGGLWGMGLNDKGQLGDGTTTNHASPVPIATGVRFASAGYSHSHYVRTDGTLWGMGSNGAGELGDGSFLDRLIPVQIATGVATVNSGYNAAFFIGTNGDLWAMGESTYGRLLGTAGPVPTKVGVGFAGAATGFLHSILIDTTGAVFSAGFNGDGELGDSTLMRRTLPAKIADDVSRVGVGYFHSMFIKDDRTLWGMGQYYSSQRGAGVNSGINSLNILAAPGVGTVKEVAARDNCTLFIDDAGILWGMGLNDSGEIGGAPAGTVDSPWQIATNVTAVALGQYRSFFIKGDGTLWASGSNYSGELGDGTKTVRPAPVKIADNVAKVVAGSQHTLFLKKDGTLWGMGANDQCQLLNSTQAQYLSPVQISSGTTAMAAAGKSSFFVKNDGTLWAMGLNEVGQFGVGTKVAYFTPIQVATGVAKVTASESHAAFLKTDGTMWAMGSNDYGELGDGTETNRVSPVLVATGVTSIEAGQDRTFFIKQDHSLWSTGSNSYGRLGAGFTLLRQQPFKIPFNAPVISSVQIPLGANLGGAAIFSVQATGGGSMSYQWRRNGKAITGATGAGYSIGVVTANDGGVYDVVVTNAQGSTTSASGVMSVLNAAPVITSALTAQASPGVAFQYRIVANNDARLFGATGLPSGLSINADTGLISGIPVWTGSHRSISLSAANQQGTGTAVLDLDVVAVPAITSDPLSQEAIIGQTVTFTVTALGQGPLNYLWQKDGNPIASANKDSLVINNVKSSDAGSYTVVVSNALGSITSHPATLTIGVYSPVTITTQPLSHAVFAGGSVTFTAAANGTPTPTYQWQKNGIDVASATASTLTLNNIQVSDAGSYGLVATNAGGSATSRFARLVVLVPQANATTYKATAYPTGVTAGGNVGLDYVLTNIGTRNWGSNHYLSIRDSHDAFVGFSTLIGTNAGESKTVHLSFPAPTIPGTYTYTVQGLENGVEFFTTNTTFTLTVLAAQGNSITYNATNFPVSATPGSNLIFNYNVTNTGTKPWGANHYLSIRNGAGVYSLFASLNGVAPGQSKTVNLSLTAPSTPGVYPYYVQALESGVEFFTAQANLTLTVLAPQPNAIVYTSTRSQDNVTPGATVNLRYTLSNAGTGTWGASHYASLRDQSGNFLAFVPLNGVAPLGTKVVNFSFTAPTTPGAYSYFVQALEDGVEFFDSQDLVTINVLATPIGNAATYNASTFPSTAARGAAVSFTANLTNRGTKTWGTNHFLSLRDADNIFLGFLPLTGIAPGQSQTLTFNFTAPTAPGVYTYHVQGFESGIEFFNMSDNLVLIVP